MVKLRGPLVSLGAHGTVGQALTMRRWKGLSVAGAIPTHPDAHTRPQLANRFTYLTALILWNALSAADKAAWTAQARPYGIGGMNLYLRYQMRIGLDLQLVYPFYEGNGYWIEDRSPNNYHGTIVGATWVGGSHSPALYFDGLDDYAYAHPTPLLDFTLEDFTILLRIAFPDPNLAKPVLFRGSTNIRGWSVYTSGANRMGLFTFQLGAQQVTWTVPGSFIANQFHTVGFTRVGANVTPYVDGAPSIGAAGVHIDPATSPERFIIADWTVPGTKFHNLSLERLVIIRKALTADQHLAFHHLCTRTL